MAKTITWMNEKGGVGKTTLCFNTAWELTEQGKKVLMIDFDSQRSNLSFLAGVRDEGAATLYNVLVEKLPLKRACLAIKDNLHIIPANNSTAYLTKDAIKYSPVDFKKQLDEIAFLYDYIFIDVSPSFEVAGFKLALYVSDEIMIPMLQDVTSLNSIQGIYESFEIAKQANPNIKVAGLIINQYNTTRILGKKVEEAAYLMAVNMGTTVFNTRVRINVAFAEAVNFQCGVTTYDPQSNGAEDIKALVKELIERTSE